MTEWLGGVLCATNTICKYDPSEEEASQTDSYIDSYGSKFLLEGRGGRPGAAVVRQWGGFVSEAWWQQLHRQAKEWVQVSSARTPLLWGGV